MSEQVKTPFMETLADIAFMAGVKRYHSGDSREDIDTFIRWANEFESKHSGTEWDTPGKDYILAIEEFTQAKLEAEGAQ